MPDVFGLLFLVVLTGVLHVLTNFAAHRLGSRKFRGSLATVHHFFSSASYMSTESRNSVLLLFRGLLNSMRFIAFTWEGLRESTTKLV